MTLLERESLLFKRAIMTSLILHLLFALAIILSPRLPYPRKKGLVQYVNLIALPGGGGGGLGGGGTQTKELGETPTPQRASLKDLTTPEKMKSSPESSFRYPVDKPRRETKKPSRAKKAVIQKTTSSSKSSPGAATTQGQGSGGGLRLGLGSGSGRGLFGSALSSQIGFSTFPYTYYLQALLDRISSNWLKSQLSGLDTSGLHTTIYFKIYRSGQISDVKIEESSGIKALDLSALRAVYSSAPFPPLPQDYPDDYLGIHLIFEHSP
jgi:TonB family protein